MKLALARSCGWTLLLSGWLVLGALGQQHLPLCANGLAPVALWLACAGLLLHAGGSVLVSGRALRIVIAVLSGLLALALWCSPRGGAAAACAAAACWGALLVAASRAVRLLRSTSPRPAPPAVSAAVGALLSWACFGDAVAALSPVSLAVVPAIGLFLAALLPPAAAARGCGSGLFDCASPTAARLPWDDPSAWACACARWTMLPMMATLVVMAQWCGGDAGVASAQWVGLHLAAMLLPPLLLLWLGRSPGLAPGAGAGSAAWAAAAMAVGLVLPVCLPGLRGLMAMSLCHSVAWGLAWSATLPRRPGGRAAVGSSAPSPRLAAALVPAAVVLAIGMALGRFGPAALEAAHAGLGLLATTGVVAGSLRSSLTARAAHADGRRRPRRADRNPARTPAAARGQRRSSRPPAAGRV